VSESLLSAKALYANPDTNHLIWFDMAIFSVLTPENIFICLFFEI